MKQSAVEEREGNCNYGQSIIRGNKTEILSTGCQKRDPFSIAWGRRTRLTVSGFVKQTFTFNIDVLRLFMLAENVTSYLVGMMETKIEFGSKHIKVIIGIPPYLLTY